MNVECPLLSIELENDPLGIDSTLEIKSINGDFFWGSRLVIL